jgi:hypothetical protein
VSEFVDTKAWRFQWACISGSRVRTPFFAVEDVAVANAGRSNTLFCTYFEDSWHSYKSTPNWSVVAMTAAKDASVGRWIVVAVSASGNVWELLPSEQSERTLHIEAPHTLTNVATVENTVYACGMGRTVLRREESGMWTNISAPQPGLEEGVMGFTALAGVIATQQYAVGWKGEIWVRSSQGWQQEDSPSNANLNSLAIDANGIVYIAGDSGVMLKGSVGCWELIETGTDSNLMDVCVHDGEIFVCSDFEVFCLRESGLESEFNDDSEDAPGTCLKLASAGADGLYSVGPYDVFRRQQGVWRRLA